MLKSTKKDNKRENFQFSKKNTSVKIDKFIFKWWMNSSASALPGWICDTKFAKKFPKKYQTNQKYLLFILLIILPQILKKYFFKQKYLYSTPRSDLIQGANKAYTNLRVHNE